MWVTRIVFHFMVSIAGVIVGLVVVIVQLHGIFFLLHIRQHLIAGVLTFFRAFWFLLNVLELSLSVRWLVLLFVVVRTFIGVIIADILIQRAQRNDAMMKG